MAAIIPNRANTMLTLAQVFGKDGKQIGDLVKNFDFSKIRVNESSRDDFLHTDLAPSLGNLTSEAMKQMDAELKIMIAGTMKTIANIPPKDRNWDRIKSALLQNPLMEQDGPPVWRPGSLTKGGTNVFKVDGSPDSGIVREVAAWFQNLIGDEDVLKSTKIDINVLGRIVAQTGATVDSFESFFGKSEHHQKTIIDIGVLRFPDIDHPFFKVYRIQLHAFSTSERILFVQKDENGISGEFNCQKFKPRESVTKQLSEKVRGAAIAQAEALFG